MKKEVLKYLRSSTTMEPDLIDRLLVSAFICINETSAQKNKLISEHFITKDNETEYYLLEGLVSLIRDNFHSFSFEELIKLFEFVISPADKIVTGAIYTPKNIREYIVDNAILNSGFLSSGIKIADISCGCGSFLFDIARKLHEQRKISYFEIFQKHIYGLDIQEYSVNRTQLLLILLALSEGEDVERFEFNLHVGDALAFQWKEFLDDFNGFDVIIGNPPYVCSRNISTQTRKLLNNWEVCSSGHPDLYIPFFQIGLENLAFNGFLGYITMNTFFKSLNGRALRTYFQREGYKIKIIDFGNRQVFESKSTYTCICLIEKKSSDYIEYVKTSDTVFEENFFYNKINYSNLNAFGGWNLNQSEILNKIESTGIPFGELYKTRNGIATLKNNIFIFNPVGEDDEYYYLQNGQVYEIEKGVCRDIINPNKLTQVNDVNLIIGKAIFPYFCVDNKMCLMEESVFKAKFPKAYNYLQAKKKILSTRDKGKGKYEKWYAYGRAQSLEKMKFKLFFPHITSDIPNYVINTDENLLFYNGLAVITSEEKELYFLRKLMSSRLFWYYIRYSSKPYGSGYFSLSRNYIKNFGVHDFSEAEKDFIISLSAKAEIDSFIESKYGICMK
jgi:type I restriction-modification system DNA methylase subunit